MITQSYKIDMTPGAVPLRVKVSQYDVGVRQLVFQLFNGATALTSGSFDLSAQIVGTKPDKKGFEYSATVNATSSAIFVTVDITEQMTACAGDVVCEIRMYDNSNRISSANFILDVEQAALGADTDISETELPDIIDEARSYAAAAEDAAERAEQAAAGAVAGLELGKMTSFSDGVIVTDIDLHRAPVAGDRILFYHSTSVASPSSLTTYNDGVAVTTAISDFSMTHPAGLTLMKCVALGESLRWQTVQDIADGGYTAGIGISINGTTINNSAPQLGDDIAYSRIDSVTSGALGYFSADADCLVMDFRTDAEPYNGGYTLRLTTTGASFKYAVLQDKAGNSYAEEIPSGSLMMCKSNVSGTGSEADPVVVTVLEIGNVEMAHDVEVLKDICITEKTASGNPITVTDALPYNAVSLSAEIEPIQDLHGLPFPYVGGAYKNKLPNNNAQNTEVNGITMTVDSQGVIDLDGTASALTTIYTQGTGWGSGAPLSTFVNGQTYTWGYGKTDTEMGNVRYTVYGLKNGNVVFSAGGNTNPPLTHSFTYNSDIDSFFCYIRIPEGTQLNHFKLYPQIEQGTSETTFAPYSNICPISGRTSVTITDYDSESNTATVTIQLGQTVYGGTLNVTTGVLTITHAIEDMGSLTYDYQSANNIFNSTSALPGAASQNVFINSISSAYHENQTGMTSMINGDFKVQAGIIYVKDARFTSGSDFKTAVTGQTVCYELAAPTTLQLTPTQLTMLKGCNRLSSDGGGSMSITYKADRLAAIEAALQNT